jgi:hypothetical protein
MFFPSTLPISQYVFYFPTSSGMDLIINSKSKKCMKYLHNSKNLTQYEINKH